MSFLVYGLICVIEKKDPKFPGAYAP